MLVDNLREVGLRRNIGALLFALFVASIANAAHAQSPDVAADLLARINHERVTRGLAPYALNALLTTAAQAHAEDVAHTGRYDQNGMAGHIGSDGSTVFDRVARVGYGAYSWGRRLGENWAWYHDVASAMALWMGDAPHRDNILNPFYREIGIGVAPAPSGGFVYITDFGAQPNVLPVFIDDGASATRTLSVTLTLTNEAIAPNGDGAKTIGQATQVEISNAPNFASARWQPFAQNIVWTLSPGSGAKTVYVKYRDAQGRTATANDSIVFVAPATATPRPTANRTRTPRPTATVMVTGTPTVTPTETATPEWTPTETLAPTSVPDTPTPLASPTPAAADSPVAQSMNSVALGAFGISVMLGVLAIVRYLARRS